MAHVLAILWLHDEVSDRPLDRVNDHPPKFSTNAVFATDLGPDREFCCLAHWGIPFTRVSFVNRGGKSGSRRRAKSSPSLQPSWHVEPVMLRRGQKFAARECRR